MGPADLAHLAVPRDPQLHPDGIRLAYALREVDLDEDRYQDTIHAWDGERTRRFTHGPSDTAPRWSPDGRWLAFLRKPADDQATTQLAVMPAAGGEAQLRTDLPLGVSDLAWSPDSRQLVVVGAEWIPDLADLDDEERHRRPRRITRIPYRSDTDGWLSDRRRHLWLVDVTGDAEPRCLTPGDRDQSVPAWRPDGRAMAFLADPEGWPETAPHDQPFEVDLDTGKIVPLAPPGMWSWVGYDPDGIVHLVGIDDPFAWPDVLRVHRVEPSDPSQAPILHDLTGHTDRSVLPMSPDVDTQGPRFVEDGFLITLEGRGTTAIARVVLDGWQAGVEPQVEEVITGPRSVTGFAASGDAAILAFAATDPAAPGEIFLRRDGRQRCITDLARRLRARVDVRPTEHFTYDGDDAEIDAWAVLPPGFDDAATGTVPLIVNIHGGPTSQYGFQFFDEFQVQAGAGYLVVGSNPRGSSGRGTDWARAVVAAWNDEAAVDILDLEALVDATLARYPQAAPSRVGIMGGSYGGYAVARLLARTGRYGSAIVERGLLNWESFGGTSDIGLWFDRMFLAASLPDGVDVHHAASPTRTAHRVTTPTLVIHSEHDWRCPIEQGEQYFAALKRAGVDTEMVTFPDEGHELTRSGAPRHRVERHQIVLDWHGRFLGHPSSGATPVGAAPDETTSP